jgi:hypothetical protein
MIIKTKKVVEKRRKKMTTFELVNQTAKLESVAEFNSRCRFLFLKGYAADISVTT